LKNLRNPSFKAFQLIFLCIQVTFKLEKSNSTLYNQRVNGCNALKANSFARLMVEEITRSAKFEVKCPFKAGFYQFDPRDRPHKSTWQQMINIAPSWLKLDERFVIVIIFASRQKKAVEIVCYVEYHFFLETLLA
jgi:hypothetical protein